MHTMTFLFISIVVLYLGRKIGWLISKKILYRTAEPLGGILSIIWGGGVAFVIRHLIDWQHPNLVVKIIMGYMLGAYVSVLNFGLLDESTVPSATIPKHKALSVLPLLAYVATSILLSLLR